MGFLEREVFVHVPSCWVGITPVVDRLVCCEHRCPFSIHTKLVLLFLVHLSCLVNAGVKGWRWGGIKGIGSDGLFTSVINI